MRKHRVAICAIASIGALGLGGWTAYQPEQPEQNSRDLGDMLVGGLRETPGCLGVDAGDFMSGKNAIIAWFEDKAAAKRWYYSDAHMRSMRMAMGAEAEQMEHSPLEHVDDDVPIMVIASITFADSQELEGINMPIAQIAIELYTPLPGGAQVNGKLAPASFEVEHMKNYTAAEDD